MKLTLSSAKIERAGRLGPVCIACGNTRRFRIQGTRGEELTEIADLPDGEIKVIACGRCHSRNSIVVARVD